MNHHLVEVTTITGKKAFISREHIRCCYELILPKKDAKDPDSYYYNIIYGSGESDFISITKESMDNVWLSGGN